MGANSYPYCDNIQSLRVVGTLYQNPLTLSWIDDITLEFMKGILKEFSSYTPVVII